MQIGRRLVVLAVELEHGVALAAAARAVADLHRRLRVQRVGLPELGDEGTGAPGRVREDQIVLPSSSVKRSGRRCPGSDELVIWAWTAAPSKVSVGESPRRNTTPPGPWTTSTYLPVFSLYATPRRPTQPPSLVPSGRVVEVVATLFSNFQFTRSFEEYTGIDDETAPYCPRRVGPVVLGAAVVHAVPVVGVAELEDAATLRIDGVAVGVPPEGVVRDGLERTLVRGHQLGGRRDQRRLRGRDLLRWSPPRRPRPRARSSTPWRRGPRSWRCTWPGRASRSRRPWP